MDNVFISHAREDKDTIARPLAEALTKKGVDVWYDEYSLDLGDSLKEKIDQGLAQCDYGAVILSKRFFRKKWTREELDGLVAREVAEHRKIILPIWHNVTFRVVTQFSPTLAGKVAISTKGGIDHVASCIAKAIDRETMEKLARIDEISDRLDELKRQIREGEIETLFTLTDHSHYFMGVAHRLLPRDKMEAIINTLENELRMTRIDTRAKKDA